MRHGKRCDKDKPPQAELDTESFTGLEGDTSAPQV